MVSVLASSAVDHGLEP